MECINKKYPLGSKYQGVVLNHREVMCVRYLLKNYSILRIAKQMKLSPRTIGFYIGSVMLQLKCKNLQELLDSIKQSELLRYFDQIL
ncbi:MAG: hypothetical protein A3F17_08590 [Gammaproteobacteria bacterium RIFCSPHIGHO2_12_FULL_41_15]|nr:MAG: hypothetical protein A3F17_08590 [Gammaproteobacteria bacterium RIFCSPHIGHO2_12_FULL_41_15]